MAVRTQTRNMNKKFDDGRGDLADRGEHWCSCTLHRDPPWTSKCSPHHLYLLVLCCLTFLKMQTCCWENDASYCVAKILILQRLLASENDEGGRNFTIENRFSWKKLVLRERSKFFSPEMVVSFQPQLLRRALLSFFLNLNFTFLDLITCFPTFSSSWPRVWSEKTAAIGFHHRREIAFPPKTISLPYHRHYDHKIWCLVDGFWTKKRWRGVKQCWQKK